MLTSCFNFHFVNPNSYKLRRNKLILLNSTFLTIIYFTSYTYLSSAGSAVPPQIHQSRSLLWVSSTCFCILLLFQSKLWIGEKVNMIWEWSVKEEKNCYWLLPGYSVCYFIVVFINISSGFYCYTAVWLNFFVIVEAVFLWNLLLRHSIALSPSCLHSGSINSLSSSFFNDTRPTERVCCVWMTALCVRSCCGCLRLDQQHCHRITRKHFDFDNVRLHR